MPTHDWRQCNIDFPDRTTAGHVAAHDLRPALTAAQEAGSLDCWWYLRKRPWRLRFLAEDTGTGVIADLLDELAATGRITSWTYGIYEPETTAFGGGKGIAVAHDLFHRDSHFLLTRAAHDDAPPLRQAEVTTLLCSAMLRAAGLDWYEQGDVWEKVAALRPPPAGPAAVTPYRAAGLRQAIRTLMTTDTDGLCDPARNGPLCGYEGWVAAFESAGRSLSDLARRCHLKRGLRAVLAHHIIFHANRAALSIRDQSTLAALAVNTVFHSDEDAPSPLRTQPQLLRSTR